MLDRSGLPLLPSGGAELGASTVMLLLANPKRLMLGYLLGALMTSITLGLVIVFALKGSSTVSTTENTISPAVDLALGAIMLLRARHGT